VAGSIKDLPVFAHGPVRLLDALDERLSRRSRPSNIRPLCGKSPFRRKARSASTHTNPSRRGQMSKSPVASDSSQRDLRNGRPLKLDRSNVTMESTRSVLALFTSPIVKIPAYKVPAYRDSCFLNG
jgi:hypothetical protein